MRILLISKALLVGAYQTKLEALARARDIELTAVVPPYWEDERGKMPLERDHTSGYDLAVSPVRFNGNFHLHHYPEIPTILRRVKPDLVHIDEEPYNLATYHILRAMHRHSPRAASLFFTWQNLLRNYPFPFSFVERRVYASVNSAIAGSEAAANVLRAKGFQKPISTIPQFGVDEEFYSPDPLAHDNSAFTIGYAGRLVPEKGVGTLLRALAGLGGNWKLEIAGSGPQRHALEELGAELGIESRVHFTDAMPSGRMPEWYRHLDVLVLPSVSRPNWIEQFGRVLVEAMACGVPVIGSSCGEIPNVIADAGLVFPEGKADSLRDSIQRLCTDPILRADLAERGRARVLAHYTQARIAAATLEVYRSILLAQPRPSP